MSSYYTALFTIFIFLLSTYIPSSNGSFPNAFLGRDSITHLHFYLQDVATGKNATALPIIGKGIGFGATYVLDDALTKGPELSSEIMGRAQGMYSNAAQNDSALLMAITFVFTHGKYKGSSISMLGRNRVFDDVREMPLVGGSGAFRLARGYALARTVRFDPKTGNACVEYNLTVKHF